MLHRSSQPFKHLLLSPLNRSTTVLLLAPFNVTLCKSVERLLQLRSAFQVLVFLHTTKNWKDNRLPLPYLWPKFNLRKSQGIWKSEWKIPLESDVFNKDVTRWSLYLLKTLLFRKCSSNILLVQVNYLSPKQVKLMPTKVTTQHYN